MTSRAPVRDAVQRHLGAGPAPSAAPVYVAPAAAGHPSHALYTSLVNTDDACVIELAVRCDHCRYCKSHGH